MRTVSSFLLLILFQQSIFSQTNEWSPVSYNCYYGKDIYFFLSDIQMVNANTGYCLGYNGTVLKTTDGGKTWIEMQNYTSNGNFRAVHDIYMINQDTGWIVGGTGTIYMTTDGFKTLINQLNWPAPQVTERNLFGVHFINKEKGFACGFGGDILRTDDGGTNWRLLTVQENPAYDASFLSEILFTSPDTGYAAGSVIEKTTDGGASWKIIYSKLNSSNILQDIFFLNSDLGWAVGSNDTLLATTNGGQTWVPQQLPVKDLDLRSVEFVSPTEGIIWASLKSDGSSKVFRTQNGGLNWMEESMTPEVNKYFLSGASFRSGNQWVSIGVGYLGMMFRNCKLPKPTISKVKSDLVSSYASGNQWYKNNVLIPGATSKTINPTKTGSGSYTVKSILNDCSSFISNPYIIGTVKKESFAKFTVRDTELQDIITIYPNPSQDQIYVNGIKALSTVEIVNMTGAKVLQRNIQGRSTSIDVSRLHPGVYFVVVRQGSNPPVIQKMIKE